MSEYQPGHKIHTLCWDCKNALGGCEWSKAEDYGPVPGWEAIPTKIRIDVKHGIETDSFIVLKCPRFKRDALEFGQKKMRGRRK